MICEGEARRRIANPKDSVIHVVHRLKVGGRLSACDRSQRQRRTQTDGSVCTGKMFLSTQP